jgi:hypothetical protein
MVNAKRGTLFSLILLTIPVKWYYFQIIKIYNKESEVKRIQLDCVTLLILAEGGVEARLNARTAQRSVVHVPSQRCYQTCYTAL